MNLRQTIQALEQNNIIVSTDIGVHQYCDINSNCPVAVELRKYIHESGVTLKDLLEGFAAFQTSSPAPERAEPDYPEFDGQSTINIAGQTVKIDYTETIKRQLGSRFSDKMNELNSMSNRCRTLGVNLHHTYRDLYDRLKNTKELPQLSFGIAELIMTKCHITSDSNNYIFLFPRHYKPQWIVTRGVRHEIDPKDVADIERDVFIRIVVTRERKILHALLLHDTGEKLYHYHGTHNDCWGMVVIPEMWDGRLRSLDDLATQLIRSLATINKDSLMTSEPPDMPEMDDVFENSTKLGEEGQIEEREHREGGATWTVGETADGTAEEGTTRRRWGQRPRRTGNRPPADAEEGELTIEEEYMRRWGAPGNPPDTEAICALCGERWGIHNGFICRTREARRLDHA